MNKAKLQTAGVELIKGNFGNAIKSFASTFISPSEYRGVNENWFVEMSNTINGSIMSLQGVQRSLYAYKFCSPVTSIINRKAMAFSNGKLIISNTSGKANGKEATGDVATSIRRLLSKPNKIQSGREFEMMAYIYKQIFGWCIILPIIPVGFPKHKATAWWIIPPTMLNVQEVNDMFIGNEIVESISLSYKGKTVKLIVDDLLILKDITPSFNSMVLPESRLSSLTNEITNIIGAYESRNVLITQRGPDKIISSDAGDSSGRIALSDPEKKQVQQDFEKYGLLKGQWRQIITNAAIKVQTIGYSTRDLMLFEEIQDDIARICDGYAYPYDLISKQEGTTFTNGNTAGRDLYQNAIIPESDYFYSQISEWLQLDSYSLGIEKDFSKVSALQGNKKEDADADYSLSRGLEIDFRNDVITLNQWRIKKGNDPVDGGDVYYSSMKDLLGPSVSSLQNNTNNGQAQQNNGNQA